MTIESPKFSAPVSMKVYAKMIAAELIDEKVQFECEYESFGTTLFIVNEVDRKKLGDVMITARDRYLSIFGQNFKVTS